MECVYCENEDTKVIDSRESGSEVRRRRECDSCEKRFTTYERADSPLTVVKNNGEEEEFQREKLKEGILKACNKRPVTEKDVENIVGEIESEINDKKVIKSKEIGNLVLEKLKETDEVSYLRFASVCRGFDSAQEFEKELKSLKIN